METLPPTCVHCDSTFKKTKKGYNRIAVRLVCRWDTYNQVFGRDLSSSDYKTKFMCRQCRSLTRLTIAGVNRGKRTHSQTTSQKSPNNKRLKQTPKQKKVNYRHTSKCYIDVSRYDKAFRCLIRGSTKAKDAFIKLCLSFVREEVCIIFLFIHYLTFIIYGVP